METITVVGAGIIGLTSAISLQEAGYNVQIVTKELPEDTTSWVAAAFWYPYIVQPEEAVLWWGEATYKKFKEQCSPESGIVRTPIRSLSEQKEDDPAWASMVDDFRRLTLEELEDGYQDGFWLQSYMVEMPIYMKYLQAIFEENGGKMVQREVATLDDLEGTVINCTGVGACKLCNDDDLVPVRGQVVSVENPGIDIITFDHHDVHYIVPRTNDCIVGGTAEVGDWELEPREETTAEILKTAPYIDERIRGVEPKEALVGLRPSRSEVRLEKEGNIIHNYGHGGAGVTLCWGCAEAVVELVQGS